MIGFLSKKTVRLKSLRRFARRFFRNRFESLSYKRLNLSTRFLHLVQSHVYNSYKNRAKLFDIISIQTITGCNYSCPFCPANRNDLNLYGGAASKSLMDISLYKKIMKELSGLSFNGRISPYYLNESLLDERLPDLVAMARAACPQSFIFIQTNGSLMDEKLFKELVKAGINEVYVNDYTKNSVVINRIQKFSLEKNENLRLTFEKRSFDERLSNRSGNVKHYVISAQPLRIPCVKPFRQIFIGYDGKVCLCCNDWQFEKVMGEAKKQSLVEIWNTEQYKTLRRQLAQSDRSGNSLCSKCDFSGLW